MGGGGKSDSRRLGGGRSSDELGEDLPELGEDLPGLEVPQPRQERLERRQPGSLPAVPGVAG